MAERNGMNCIKERRKVRHKVSLAWLLIGGYTWSVHVARIYFSVKIVFHQRQKILGKLFAKQRKAPV